MQHVSDLHPIFALRPHHVWKYGEERKKKERKKERRRKKKPQDENIMVCPIP